MKSFELSNKKTRNGRRKFKLILHEIYPDSCIDEVNEVGTQYNKNGITWIEEYCKNNIDTIKDMSIRAEFADYSERVEILGHGETGVKNGLPLFENAVVVGHFTGAQIETITDDDGAEKRVCSATGYIDEMCYPDFVKKLMEDIEIGNTIPGSVEIIKSDDNDAIVYKYGYKEEGRIPVEFRYSGYALLGVTPADDTAKLLEINESRKEDNPMNEEQIKAIIGDTVREVMNVSAEINQAKTDAESMVETANTSVADKDVQIAELNSKYDACVEELENCKREKAELEAKIADLNKQIVEAQKKEKCNEMNAAIAGFTDAERAFAQAEIDAFNADPISSEINTVVSAIYAGIGKKAKESATVVAEQNAENANVEDIFAEVSTTSTEDSDIF